MAETYCGKSCEDCIEKKALSCYGCKQGPGRPNSGECKIARCCRGKGHQECSTCSFSGGCSTLRGRERMAEYRLNERAAKKAKAAAMEAEALFLSKWIWALFWLFIPQVIAGIMLVTEIPVLQIPGLIINDACTLVYGLILIKMGEEFRRFRIAGICLLVSAFLGWISGGSWEWLITFVAGIVAIVGVYYECTAYASALVEFNENLAEKWMALWKWYIRMFGVRIVGAVLVLIPALGLPLMLVGIIGDLVVSIAKLNYMLKTAELFQEYAYDPVSEQI